MDVREKLVELLGKVQDYGTKNTCEGWSVTVECKDNETIADHLIANGVTVQEWIPVTERLPDLELVEVKTDDKDVFPCLAVRKHPRAKNGKYTAKVWYDGYGFIDGVSNDVTDEVTHWMPLPQLPKGE